MKNTTILSLAFALILSATPVLAQDTAEEPNEGLQLMQRLFSGFDTESRGIINMSQFLRFGDDVFVSMDRDEDELVTLAEFMDWDYGMRIIAEDRDLVPSFETGLRVLYAFWDRNGDDQITLAEFSQFLAFDFQRADTDQDGLLTEIEFLEGFSVVVALRAALNPEPVE